LLQHKHYKCLYPERNGLKFQTKRSYIWCNCSFHLRFWNVRKASKRRWITNQYMQYMQLNTFINWIILVFIEYHICKKQISFTTNLVFMQITFESWYVNGSDGNIHWIAHKTMISPLHWTILILIPSCGSDLLCSDKVYLNVMSLRQTKI
jgi:hypothetical protein